MCLQTSPVLQGASCKLNRPMFFTSIVLEQAAIRWRRYNDGNPASRNVLAGRLYQAMTTAWSATKRAPLNGIGFRSAKLMFQPRKDPKYSLRELSRLLASDLTPRRERLDAALGISWLRRSGSSRVDRHTGRRLRTRRDYSPSSRGVRAIPALGTAGRSTENGHEPGLWRVRAWLHPYERGPGRKLRRPLQLGRLCDVRSHTSKCDERGAR